MTRSGTRRLAQHIPIKGRAYGADSKTSPRLGTIKEGAASDTVLLVQLGHVC